MSETLFLLEATCSYPRIPQPLANWIGEFQRKRNQPNFPSEQYYLGRIDSTTGMMITSSNNTAMLGGACRKEKFIMLRGGYVCNAANDNAKSKNASFEEALWKRIIDASESPTSFHNGNIMLRAY
eukprot:scaffold177_cov334-Pavlova_lutheri.AAC.47